MEETKHRKWTVGAIDEHNALYDAWANVCQNNQWNAARLEQALAREAALRAELAKRDEPIADMETLEELAKIAFTTFYDEDDWYEMTILSRKAWCAAAAAVLRAARPYVDVTPKHMKGCLNQLYIRSTSLDKDDEDFFTWLNSNIRYRVEMPAT